MKKLVTEQGTELHDHEDIKREVKCFYEALYKKRQVEDCEIENLVQDFPVLTNEQSAQIEGNITLVEATSALKKHEEQQKSRFSWIYFWIL